jgi:hypothetical protein
MSEWQDGFSAGWGACLNNIASGRGDVPTNVSQRPRQSGYASRGVLPKDNPKIKRKASAYSKSYGRHFKRLAPKYKKKSGGWKKNGFKRCAAAARKAAKK